MCGNSVHCWQEMEFLALFVPVIHWICFRTPWDGSYTAPPPSGGRRVTPAAVHEKAQGAQGPAPLRISRTHHWNCVLITQGDRLEEENTRIGYFSPAVGATAHVCALYPSVFVSGAVLFSLDSSSFPVHCRCRGLWDTVFYFFL